MLKLINWGWIKFRAFCAACSWGSKTTRYHSWTLNPPTLKTPEAPVGLHCNQSKHVYFCSLSHCQQRDSVFCTFWWDIWDSRLSMGSELSCQSTPKAVLDRYEKEPLIKLIYQLHICTFKLKISFQFRALWLFSHHPQRDSLSISIKKLVAPLTLSIIY